MSKKKFKFSIIIPIYNVEEYLSETIESVVNQTIGFEENVQLILVNDGSPDNSESICLEYRDKYPQNVVYIKQDNAGVSAARNKGMEYVKGEFVNFLDSDDKWSKDAFKETYSNYKKHKDIKMFSCRMNFFDAKKGRHPLNYKYKKNKIINIMEDYDYPQLSSSSIFIHKDLIKGHNYDSKIKFSEDNKFINEMILEEGKYMVLNKPTYYYRRRQKNNSAIQEQSQKKDWYTVTPIKVYKYLCDLSIKKYGRIIEYIQYLVMYEINWRLSVKVPSFLTKMEQKNYIKTLKELLFNVKDEIILSLRNADLAKKVYVLSLKNGEDYIQKIEYDENFANVDDFMVSFDNLGYLIIDNISIRKNTIFLYGKLDTKFVSKKDFSVLLNDKKIKPKFYELTNDYDEELFTGEKLHQYIGISLSLNIKDNFKLLFKYKDFDLTPRFKRSSIFFERMPSSFKKYNNRLICYKRKNKSLNCENDNIFKRFYYELKNCLFLLRYKKIKVALIRIFISLYNSFKHQKIMLISDRVNKADDNGEHFFKYMLENHPEYKCYYILSKDSVDYDKMCKIGPVLDNTSTKYKWLFQISDYVVSSHAEDYIFNILGKNNKYVQDKYKFKYIFLQHGIIKDDLSPWLNINTKKMDMFVTSCGPEYQSLLDCKYYYGKDIVKLTGLPRYDSLIKKQQKTSIKKQVLLSCTWRNSLANKVDRKTGQRLYNEKFKESNYFKFLNSLMNDKRLLKALEKNNYKIRFCPHPNVLTQLEDFNENDYVEIERNNIDYQKEFCENALLITDYSSVFFDFGYLKKPVVYLQHDRKEFFEGQLYDEGYFDYKKMGFGPVCSTLDSAVKEIIGYIENDCKMQKKYLKRVDNFYSFHDDKNCERVFKAITSLDE